MRINNVSNSSIMVDYCDKSLGRIDICETLNSLDTCTKTASVLDGVKVNSYIVAR